MMWALQWRGHLKHSNTKWKWVGQVFPEVLVPNIDKQDTGSSSKVAVYDNLSKLLHDLWNSKPAACGELRIVEVEAVDYKVMRVVS